MTTIGLIGSGHIGSTLARLAVIAGYQVVLSNSRGPQTLGGLVQELEPAASAATPAEAAEASDLVVVTIPVKAYPDVPAAQLRGKVTIDTGNYYPQRDGQIEDLDSGRLTSSEYLLSFIPGARLVKAFNNINYQHLLTLARTPAAPDRSYLPIAGDEAAVKEAVSLFLDSIGYGTVDAGSLADSWRQQPGMPVYGSPYGTYGESTGTPASRAIIETALAAASR